MLGVAKYQEALRALGSLAVRDLRLVEQPAHAALELSADGRSSRITAAQLLGLIDGRRARRGNPTTAGNVSDVLRSIGLALDELSAREIELVLCADSLDVTFRSSSGARHDLSYAGEELEALRRAAAARRTGQPMRRVLILH